MMERDRLSGDGASGWVSGREVKIGIRVGFANRELGTSVGMSSRVGEEYGEGRR